MPHPATPIYNSLVSALKHDTRPLAINVYNLSQIRHYETIWREHFQMLGTRYNPMYPLTGLTWDDANFMQHSRDYIKYFNKSEIHLSNIRRMRDSGDPHAILCCNAIESAGRYNGRR